MKLFNDLHLTKFSPDHMSELLFYISYCRSGILMEIDLKFINTHLMKELILLVVHVGVMDTNLCWSVPVSF